MEHGAEFPVLCSRPCWYLFHLFFWSCRVACGILVPQPGIKPVPPALEAQSVNHWTTRGVPVVCFKYSSVYTSVPNSQSQYWESLDLIPWKIKLSDDEPKVLRRDCLKFPSCLIWMNSLHIHEFFKFFNVLKFIYFNWRIIALQYSFDFYHTWAWISRRCTHAPFLVCLPPTPHSSPPL